MSQAAIQAITNGGATYCRFTEHPVSYSGQVSDGVVADFDANGGLRGIEVLTDLALAHTSIEQLVMAGTMASRGPNRSRTVVIPEPWTGRREWSLCQNHSGSA